MLKIVFRTDASIMIGTGHVMRCLALADELKRVGAECTFVCRPHPGNMIDTIEQRGHAVATLPEVQGDFEATLQNTVHAKWLGTDWYTDALETVQLLGDLLYDWMIVDHYALDVRWGNYLSSHYKKLMVIDDLADRKHDCDLLLDQNYGSSAERYGDFVHRNCVHLHGPEFALLNPIYAQRRAEQSVRSGKIDRILIYFGGGADPMNLTGMALHSFHVPELNNIELDFVVGSDYAHKAELEAVAANLGRAHIHTHLPDLSELMVRADLAIGAGGATTWERCCLGLPSIVISTAKNQLPACQALAAEDAIKYLGHFSDLKSDALTRAIIDMVSDPQQLELYSRNCRGLVDGLGVGKVVSYLYKQHEGYR